MAKMKKIKVGLIVGFMGLLRMAIVIFVLREIWTTPNLSIIMQLMLLLLMLNFMTQKWFKALDKITNWLLNKMKGEKTTRKGINIGFQAEDQKEKEKLLKKIEEIDKRGKGVPL